MNVELKEDFDGKVLTVRATGKLTREDYHHFAPEIERLIKKHGKIRVLFDMHDFHGWKAAAVWEDMKFDAKHFRDIERLAMVGDKTWEKWMATFCRPFTTAAIRYFDHSEVDEAHKWIEEALSTNPVKP
jgi:hypothetical protein